MDNAAKIAGTEDAWESGLLGADEAHAKVAPDQEKEIDAALELQPISIRLQKGLLDNLKALAQLNGIGYQPLIRQILTRWVDCEMRNMLATKLAEQRAEIKRTSEQSRQVGDHERKAA